jgi:hypothetical protein
MMSPLELPSPAEILNAGEAMQSDDERREFADKLRHAAPIATSMFARWASF